MEVILDCTRFIDKAASHAYLKEQFQFPDYYGNNLDALYDCLTELSDCQIILRNPAALHKEGSYGSAVLETLKDAAQANPHLELSTCTQYKAEIRERWGDTTAYREFDAKNHTPETQQELATQMGQIFASFARCMEAGLPPDSAEVQALVKRLQDSITETCYTCTYEILAHLGQMYTADPRFQANIDRHSAGTADFVSRAISHYCH